MTSALEFLCALAQEPASPDRALTPIDHHGGTESTEEKQKGLCVPTDPIEAIALANHGTRFARRKLLFLRDLRVSLVNSDALSMLKPSH